MTCCNVIKGDKTQQLDNKINKPDDGTGGELLAKMY